MIKAVKLNSKNIVKLHLKGEKLSTAVKVPIPKDLESLIEISRGIFNFPEGELVLSNQFGHKIQKFSSIKPDMTLSVSIAKDNSFEETGNSKSNLKTRCLKSDFEQSFNDRKNSENISYENLGELSNSNFLFKHNDSFACPKNEISRISKAKVEKSIDFLDDSSADLLNINIGDNTVDISDIIVPPTNRKKSVQNSRISDNIGDYALEISESDFQSRDISTLNVDNCDSADYQPNYNSITGNNSTYVRTPETVCLFTDDTNCLSCFKEAFCTLPPKEREFFIEADKVEMEQAKFWSEEVLKNFFDKGFTEFQEEYVGYDKIVENCRTFIENRRFDSAIYSPLYYLQTVIFGPKRSGKSTILSTFTKELIKEIASNKEYKRTCFYFLDPCLLFKNLGTPHEFIYTLIDWITEAFTWQKPFESIAISAMKQLLKNQTFYQRPLVVNDKQTKVERDIISLLDQLSLIITDKKRFDDNLSLIADLPFALGKILGFTRFFVICDDIDQCCTEKTMTFANGHYLFNSARFISLLLDRSNYIVSFKDQEQFSKMLSLEHLSGSSLHSCERFPTYNIITSGNYMDSMFKVKLDDTERPLFIQFCDFGGVPAYIDIWYKLNEIQNAVENADGEIKDSDDDCLELDIKLRMYAQIMLVSIFKMPEKFLIKDIYRVE